MKFTSLVISPLGLFKRSLQARSVAFTVLLSGFALLILGGFLSYSIGNGLYQTRLQQVLEESSRDIAQTQSTLAASSLNDEVALQALINSVIPALELKSTNQSRKVALLRTPNQTAQPTALQSPLSADLDPTVITNELRSQVVENAGQLTYRSVTITVDARQIPGVVVGANLEVPVAGSYELYLVYDLQSDQQTLDFVQQTLAIGGAVLILIIGMVSFFVSNVVVKPVRVAAEVAEQIAAGDLSRRLPERGQDVIAVLARSFNRMAQSLQRQITAYESVSQMQQRFVSDVSHELRTPLTTIKLAGEVIFNDRENLAPNLQRPTEIMRDQILRFEQLLTDLLEISRYDAGSVSAELEVTDLNGVVGMAVAGLEPLAASKSSKIRIKVPNGAVEAEMDARRIERLIRNLLANAIEHGQGKPVDVEVGASASAVAVTVTDYGIGMNKEDLRHVFDRFWRADPSRKRSTGGTGLGLAISLEDTNLHRGWLQVWSEPNNGASFRLTLPRTSESVIRNSPLPLPPAKPLGPIRAVKQKQKQKAGDDRA